MAGEMNHMPDWVDKDPPLKGLDKTIWFMESTSKKTGATKWSYTDNPVYGGWMQEAYDSKGKRLLDFDLTGNNLPHKHKELDHDHYEATNMKIHDA